MDKNILGFADFVNESWVWGKQLPEIKEMLEFLYKPNSNDLRYPELLKDKVYPAIKERGTLRFKAKYPDYKTLEKELAEFKEKVFNKKIPFNPEARIINRFLVLCVLLMTHSQCENREMSSDDIANDRSNLCPLAFDYVIGEHDSILQGVALLATGKWDMTLHKVG